MIDSSMNRRTLLAASGAAAAFTVAPGLGAVEAKGEAAVLRIALIGCGGRGSGAAANALSVDPKTKIVAVADAFSDRLEKTLEGLRKGFKERIEVGDDRKFVGIDAYLKVMALPDVDMVILTTPPGFRPDHITAAVDAGKHVFAEKPLAVDPAGWRKVKAATDKAREKGLCFMTGFCYRWDMPKVEAMNQILGGKDNNEVAAFTREILGVTAPSAELIGEVTAAFCSYNTGELWLHDRQPEWNEATYQLRNWLYYTWLSGDHIVEQGIHNVDKIAWVFNDQAPVSAYAMGGRQSRTDAKFGHVYDHFAVLFEFPNKRFAHFTCRQQNNTDGATTDEIIGTKGSFNLQSGKPVINGRDGEKLWSYKNPKGGDMYANEHKVLNAAIRRGIPFNCATQALNSCAMGIMGRISAYTGKRITFDQFVKMEEDLFIKDFNFNSDVTSPEVAIPGKTQIH